MKMLKTEEFKDFDIKKTLEILHSTKKGITEDEVKRRLEIFGYNEIPRHEENLIVAFFKEFVNPLSLLIEITILISFLTSKTLEGILLFSLLLINIGISFSYKVRAKNASKKL